MNRCCMGCEKRYLACHDSCEVYLQEVARDKEIKKKRLLDIEYNACAKELSRERKKKWQNKRK